MALSPSQFDDLDSIFSPIGKNVGVAVHFRKWMLAAVMLNVSAEKLGFFSDSDSFVQVESNRKKSKFKERKNGRKEDKPAHAKIILIDSVKK